MATENVNDARMFTYKLDITIARPPEDVWSVLTTRINDWWLPDFRVLGQGSAMSLNPSVGGALLEKSADGGFLEWYRVQMCVPGALLFLVGHVAPDWGGPTVSTVSITLKGEGDSTILGVSDGLIGNVTEKSAIEAETGWKSLLDDGLKALAEA